VTSFAAPQTVHPRSIVKLMTRGSKFFGGGCFVFSIVYQYAYCSSLYRFSGLSKTENENKKCSLFYLIMYIDIKYVFDFFVFKFFIRLNSFHKIILLIF